MISDLAIALRVYPDLRAADSKRKRTTPPPRPETMLIFDCETRTDAAQTLTFGSYRFVDGGQCLEEGLFGSDGLTMAERAVLGRYAQTHRADTMRGGNPRLQLLTHDEFLDKLYLAAYKGRCLVVNFNCGFDISRIAYGYGRARGRFLGGFSFCLWGYRDKRGRWCVHPYRPRIAIKTIDSKRAIKGFTSGTNPDEEDRIPEGSATGRPVEGYVFRGNILDLRTLAFSLSDRGFSLENACEAFNVAHGKIATAQHGVITPEYIDYNRRDTLATTELAEKLLAEFDLHPISLQATKSYSAATIGKSYIRDAMGIRPILQRQPSFPKRFLGHAQSAFYGGRTSAHVRKVPVPVVYTDFLSQYSTLNVLMGLWRFVTARQIRVVRHCEAEFDRLLRDVTPELLLDPSTWKRFVGFARVIPDGNDVLPIRAHYGASNNDWQIGVNRVYGVSDDPKDGIWYALGDLVASKILTGKVPRIVEAFRIEPEGMLDGLTPMKFRGQVSFDPRSQDFFRTIIEERKRLSRREDLSETERQRLDKSLKTLGSATTYGIWAQMDRRESDENVNVRCYGIDPTPYECRVAHPEAPGEYCFPALASVTTSGGHVLLALLERFITDLGGTYCAEDTDGMTIVSSRRGGLVPCPGGPYRTRDGREAIKALSWEQVREIVDRFAQLNPHDRNAVPGSILKIEGDNFDPKTKKQRQLWCYAIASKRFALFLRDKDGAPILLRSGVNNGEDRWSEHGLGHLLNPTDPDSDDREWIAQAWLRIIRKALGFKTGTLGFEKLPAIGRVTVSSPWVMRAFAPFNKGKPYAEQIKPFNFLLSAHVRELGHPIGVDPERFHLIAPYETDPRKWLALPWIDEYSTERYRITTSQVQSHKTAAVKTYGDVLRAYEHHPELKCAGPDGKPCSKQTVGLLGRRHVRIGALHFIGKESNLLEEVEAGQVHDLQDVYTEYRDARRERDTWEAKILPALKRAPVKAIARATGLDRRTIQRIRNEGTTPHPRHRALLAAFAQRRTSEESRG